MMWDAAKVKCEEALKGMGLPEPQWFEIADFTNPHIQAHVPNGQGTLVVKAMEKSWEITCKNHFVCGGSI